MDMVSTAVIVVAVIVTLWVTSLFAKLMYAKNGSMVAIVVTWLVGAALSFGLIVALDIFVLGEVERAAIMVGGSLLIFTILYKFVNKMNWTAAITTNVTAIAVGAIAAVVTIVYLEKPVDRTILMASSVIGLTKPMTEQAVESVVEDEEAFVVFTDNDLLNPETQVAMAVEKKRLEESYHEPKFTVMSVRGASGVIGYRVRLLKNSDKVIEGSLVKVEGGELVIKQSFHGGIATTPIAISSIKKMEVYK